MIDLRWGEQGSKMKCAGAELQCGGDGPLTEIDTRLATKGAIAITSIEAAMTA